MIGAFFRFLKPHFDHGSCGQCPCLFRPFGTLQTAKWLAVVWKIFHEIPFLN
jgi:hypothetical protein